jgi:hypothetical protein
MAVTSEHISFAFDRLSRCVDETLDMAMDERRQMINVCKTVHRDNKFAPVVQIQVTDTGLTMAAGVMPLNGEAFGWFAHDMTTKTLFKVALTESPSPKALPTMEAIEAFEAAHASD